MFSILHISDLHRTPGENLTNAELISALLGDRSRYMRENPKIAAPQAIIVSGDVIQGVPLGVDNASAVLAEQYRVAEEFLVELAERFLDGDRSRVVIVPGNHDIDWATARAAMQPVPDETKVELPKALLQEGSTYRWNWRERRLYAITDQSVYARRLEAFWKFFESFYSGVPNLMRVGRDRPVNLFSLADGRVGVAAFNSCHGNDCFSFQGAIPREAVAEAHLELSEAKHGFELLLAVWHHNVEGPPHRSDYMDVDIVRGMIGRGFRMGLYGHQHRPEAVPHHIHLAEQETMAVIAAGSLCAGAKELPPGSHRGYNIVELADDFQSARVHVRQMDIVSNLFTRSPRAAFGGQSWTEMRWLPPADLLGRPIDTQRSAIEAAINEAEQTRRHDPAGAVEILLPHRDDLPHFGRRVLVEAALAAGQDALVVDLLHPPQGAGELVELIQAQFRTRDFDAAERALDQHAAPLSLTLSLLNDFKSRIAAHRAMSR